ncbi:Plant transposase [Abeliophyllum distichum]|uniref:Plant transposase n=1 Tax=Abeliophyllum distichum TaxID=126358 RepID=A0ABD1QVJ0_9LAMI
MWRDWKSQMKRKYYNGKTKEECLAIVPQEISVEQLKVLVEYWSTDRVEEISEKNKQNRMMLGPLHRTGRKSCANIRREMEEAGKPTDTLSVYIEMRTDLGGNPKDDYAAALIV